MKILGKILCFLHIHPYQFYWKDIDPYGYMNCPRCKKWWERDYFCESIFPEYEECEKPRNIDENGKEQ